MFGGYTLQQIQADPSLYGRLGEPARRRLAEAGYQQPAGGDAPPPSGPPMAGADPRQQIIELMARGLLPPEVLQRVGSTLGLNPNFVNPEEFARNSAYDWFRQGETAGGRNPTAESFNHWWLQQQLVEALRRGEGGSGVLNRLRDVVSQQPGAPTIGEIPRTPRPQQPPQAGGGGQGGGQAGGTGGAGGLVVGGGNGAGQQSPPAIDPKGGQAGWNGRQGQQPPVTDGVSGLAGPAARPPKPTGTAPPPPPTGDGTDTGMNPKKRVRRPRDGYGRNYGYNL